jgi:hypothetical protein
MPLNQTQQQLLKKVFIMVTATVLQAATASNPEASFLAATTAATATAVLANTGVAIQAISASAIIAATATAMLVNNQAAIH